MGLGWVNMLAWDTSDGTAVSNTTTPTSILSGTEKPQMQPNYLNFVGAALRGEVFGRISTVVTTPGTLTLDIRFGSVIVFTSPAFALNTTAKTNVSFLWEFDLSTRTIGTGTSATMFGHGRFSSEAVVGSPVPGTGGSGILLAPASAPAVGTGFDSTSAQTVDCFATWSIANASNSIQKHKYRLWSLNGAG